MTVLKIIDVIQTKNAVSMESGVRLLNAINHEISNNQDYIILDFDEVSILATPFVNASIAYLLKDYTPEWIKNHISLINVNDRHKHSINVSMKNALNHFHKGR